MSVRTLWQTAAVTTIAVCAALAPGAARAATPPPAPCTFVTTGTNSPSTVVAKQEGTFCVWPNGSRSLQGTLTFKAGQQIEFRGDPSITADTIRVDQGAVLAGISSRLDTLVLHGRNAVSTGGEFNVQAKSKIVVTSGSGGITLLGPTRIISSTVQIQAASGKVSIAPPDMDAIDVGAFTVLGCTKVTVKSTGAEGRIIINRSRIGGRTVLIETKVNLSDVGDKSISVLGSIVTTHPGETGCSVGTAITMNSSGSITISAAQIKAATKIIFTTQHAPDTTTGVPGDNVCLADQSLLEADGSFGDINTQGVRGTPLEDIAEPSTIEGRVVGDPFFPTTERCPFPQ